MNRQKVIAVDFDGTLFTNAYPNIGKPIKPMIDHIKLAQAAGEFIILWTCRCDEHLAAAVAACAEQGLTFDAVNDNAPDNIAMYNNNSRKVNADIYIDDKCMSTALLLLSMVDKEGGYK